MDQAYTAEEAAGAAAAHGIRLGVVKHNGPERGFVLLPRRVGERSFAWTARFRRLARDYERVPRPWPASTPLLAPASRSSMPPSPVVHSGL